MSAYLHPDTVAQMRYERARLGISFILISDALIDDFDPENHARVRGLERFGEDEPVVEMILTREEPVAA